MKGLGIWMSAVPVWPLSFGSANDGSFPILLLRVVYGLSLILQGFVGYKASGEHGRRGSAGFCHPADNRVIILL